jgi:hypothetical protein
MWLLVLLAVLAALGTDGIIRSHPQGQFRRPDDTALYLFLPVLFTIAVAVFLEMTVSGYWAIPAGLGMALPIGLVAHAEYHSVDRDRPEYATARLLLNMATYLTAFLFFATIYGRGPELGLPARAVLVGVASLLLAVDVLREEAMDAPRTLIYALAVGALLGQVAWAVHFLPLEAMAAAVLHLLAFYLVVGIMHHYLGERLTLRTASEFWGIASLGMALVVVAHRFLA